jgi:hypothetical protein
MCLYNVIPLLPWWEIMLSWWKQLKETPASSSRHWNHGKWNSSCLPLLSGYFSLHLKALLPSVLCACHVVTYSSPNYFNIANFIKISAVLRVTAYWRFTKWRFGTSCGCKSVQIFRVITSYSLLNLSFLSFIVSSVHNFFLYFLFILVSIKM